jgi:universal stress protein E
MRPIRRILVAVKDFESKSLPEVTKAAQLAHALGAELELFRAITAPLYVDAYSFDDTTTNIERTTRTECLEKLEAIATRLRGQGLKVNVCAQWDYPAYEAIVRRASRVKADLIVAARHMGRHIAPTVLRLTDWELLRLSPVPVLLVRSAEPYERPVVLAAVDPAHTFSKPAQLDAEILRLATTVVTALRGTLHAVHAYIPFPLRSFPSAMAKETVTAMETKRAKVAGRGFARTLRSVRIPKTRRHLVALHPVDAIEQTARETRSAIVVMGAISRSGIKRLFIGNTAESVLDYLPCDVLVVKPAQFARRVQRASRGLHFAAMPTTSR